MGDRAWSVRGLGYLGVETADVDGWRRLGTEVLGMEPARTSTEERLLLKMDEQRCRIAVHAATTEGLAFVGWELPDLLALEAAVTELEHLGIPVKTADEGTAADREVAALVQVDDPEGNHLELYVGARRENVRGFRSPTGARFVTGEMGLGHIVLWCGRYDESFDFYTRVLGLGTTDLIVGGFRAAFLGATPRHHSVALFASFDGTSSVDHFMIEVASMTTVGQAHDRCLAGAGRISYTLGQHWNDRATSFYVQTPSGFDIEYGFGPIQVDRARWTATVGDGDISFWGHHAATPELARKHRADVYLPNLDLEALAT